MLALEHRQIPPSLHFEQPNPQIDFASSPFYVNTAAAPTGRADGAPRRAGVSSFGIGGTNAHVVLEEAPEPAPSGPSRPWQLLLLSARTADGPGGGHRPPGRLHLAAHPEADLADVAYTLQAGRRALRAPPRRWSAATPRGRRSRPCAARDPRRLLGGVRGRRPTGRWPSSSPAWASSTRAWRRASTATSRSSASELDRCAELLQPLLGLDLRDAALPRGHRSEPRRRRDSICAPCRRGATPRRGRPPLDRTAIAQPALFAVEYALARLWMEWGVRPRRLLGHSLGEYVAACLAGVFSLEDALRARGRARRG